MAERSGTKKSLQSSTKTQSRQQRSQCFHRNHRNRKTQAHLRTGETALEIKRLLVLVASMFLPSDGKLEPLGRVSCEARHKPHLGQGRTQEALNTKKQRMSKASPQL